MLSIKQIQKCTNAKVSKPFPASNITTLIIDTRKAQQEFDALFICLVTSNNNGHKYIADAYNKGIKYFLVSEVVPENNYADACILQVKDTLKALQQIAAFNRKKYNYPVIGITGSNAKTIIKEWLFALLDGSFNITRSPKSYNSQIGVALSVWEMQKQHSLAILEAGISMPGEMESLANIIQPTIGIFTNIGDAHSENFESITQKTNEKLKLFTTCDKVIFSINNKVLQAAISANKIAKSRWFTWGETNANVIITRGTKQKAGTVLQVAYGRKKFTFTFSLEDEASIENICHCIATALYLKIPIALLQQKITAITPIAMRLEIKNGLNNCTIINDSYNNDIGALHIALDALKQQKQHKYFTVILSDILQSSTNKLELYGIVSKLLVKKKIDRLIAIGEGLELAKSKFLNIKNVDVLFYPNTKTFLEQLPNINFKDEAILLKGARSFAFEDISNELEAKIHQTVLEINLNALAENYKTYQNLVNKDVALMAMVKAFSYGAGAVEVSQKLVSLGVNYLAVAYADEGVHLRRQGIELPIMVMNASADAFDGIIKYKLETELYSNKILQQFIDACIDNDVTHYPVHLKIDTGMHRLGFLQHDLQMALATLQNTNSIKIQSVFSHLAASDDATLDDFTLQQAQIFETAINEINKVVNYEYYKHLCNTSGIVRHPSLHYNMVRLGIGLYGVDYSGLLGKKIKNISRLKTQIAQIKELQPGETVGYSRKGTLQRKSFVATVCIGYADGVSRALGNGKGKMYINGTLCPVLGNVCMDMCMLDVTDVPNVKEGDEVIIFGPELPITRVAEMAGTIAYEIMTDISTRVKRVYFDE